MPDNPVPDPASVPEIQARLQAVAKRLRETRSLDPESRRTLAELVGELSTVLQSSQVPPSEVARLAETTTHLADSLQHHHEPGVLGKVRDQFEQAVLGAEAKAPVAVGVARRLLDALANLGI
jgi:hypothetical protein